MTVQFNHTVISSKDKEKSAHFMTDLFGLPAPTSFGPFMVVKLDNNVSLDFVTTTKEIYSRHFAFLVGETDFDEIFERIRTKNMMYWADHNREHPLQINHNDGGRGLYFNDLDGHFLEIITRPYGAIE